MSDNTYKEYEDAIEKRIKEVESTQEYDSRRFEDLQHEISDLKHQLWQSRL